MSNTFSTRCWRHGPHTGHYCSECAPERVVGVRVGDEPRTKLDARAVEPSLSPAERLRELADKIRHVECYCSPMNCACDHVRAEVEGRVDALLELVDEIYGAEGGKDV